MVEALEKICPAISAHLLVEGWGLHHHDEASRRCSHQLQDLTHLLNCPASEPLRRGSFDTTFSIFDLCPDLGAWHDCWVCAEFFNPLSQVK